MPIVTGSGHKPLWVGDFDVADPPVSLAVGPTAPNGAPYDRARLLVRFRGEPLGWSTVPVADGVIDVASVRADAVRQHRMVIDRIAGGPWDPDGPPQPTTSHDLQAMPVDELPAVSVVIGTRNRPKHVMGCVETVLKQHYPSPIEVLIVDNGSSDSSTAELVAAAHGADDRVRYLAEPRPGLARARNIGLSAARYPVTAFLSDDIRVDAQWLLAIARGFRRHQDVRCVTGSCPPAYLDTPEQLMFEATMSWGTRFGFEPVVHAYRSDDDPLHPYRIGDFAIGANMAFHTENFRRLGGFDEALGPGTRARGGEDLDAPIRILADGSLVAAEPAAIGWHADRFDDRPFDAHLYTYGLGLTAFLAKHLLEPDLRRGLIRRIPAGVPTLLKGFDQRDEILSREVPIPLRYHLWHLAGRAMGPVAYLRSRWAGRR
ncbi:MAG: glycosyltransferase [Actinomycetota bacterium]